MKTDKPITHKIYEFEGFRLEAAELMLYRDGEAVSLPPKAVETLLVLIENRGRILSKDELMSAIWGNMAVEESNLSQYLHILRKTLGDQSNGKPYIETLRRRGYCFSGNVAVDEANSGSEESERDINNAAVAEMTQEPASLPGAKSRWGWLAAAMLLGVVIVTSFAFYNRGAPQRESGAAVRSIAVLPFKPVTAADHDEQFEMGLADALISLLGGSPQLTVRPLSAVKRYADTDNDAAAAGTTLKTDVVLDGTYQRDGERIRLNLRLVQSSDGRVIWNEKFDEKEADIFALQDKVLNRVAQSLIPHLNESEKFNFTGRGTNNEQAFLLYQRGRHFWNQRTEAGHKKAIEAFEAAIKLDPKFAQAYSGLADSYILLGGYNYDNFNQQDTIQKAKAAAQKAVELNDRLAEPHTSLGLIAFNYDWDTSAAEAHYKRAIELNPNYATAHHWYADGLLAPMGRFDEAIAEMRRAQELDPLSAIINTDLGKDLYFARRYDEAITQLEYTLELDPGFDAALTWLATAHAAKGDRASALARMKLITTDDSLNSRARMAAIQAMSGEEDAARKTLADIERNADPKVSLRAAAWIACAYASLRENDKAFEWLEKEIKVRGVGTRGLKVAPVWDPLRSNPRFQDLVKRTGL